MGPATVDGGAPLALPFVGRTHELAALREAWAGRNVAEPTLVVVVGEPGVGKSRLIDQFADELRADGVAVLRGAATDSAFLPYEPWVQALRAAITAPMSPGAAAAVADHDAQLAGIPWLHDLVAASPAVPDAVPDESAVEDAVTGVLRRLAAANPVAVVIDDIHWADAASVTLLRRLVTAAVPDCLFVVVERSPSGDDGPWSTLDATALTRRDVEVGRFDRGVSEELIRSGTSASVPDAFVDAMVSASGGHAFVLRSLLEITRDWRSYTTEHLATLPRSAAAIWAHRFAPLPPAVLHSLSIAAVMGTAFDEDALIAAVGDEPAVRAHVQIARSFALIEPSTVGEGTWRFSHALLREHLHDRLTATRRQRLHRQVATTLEREAGRQPSARSAQIAYHWSESGPAGRASMLEHTIDAAWWAFLQGAPDSTRRLGDVARSLLDDLSGDDDDTRMAQRVRLGDLLLRVGDGAGVTLMEAAVAHYRARDDVAALASIADSLLRAGRSMGKPDVGSELAETLVDRLDEVDPRLRSRVFSRLARATEGRIGAEEFIERISTAALELARQVDDPETLAIALYCRSALWPWTDDRLSCGYELIELGEREGNLEYALLGRHMVCTNLLDRGDVAESARWLRELEALADATPRGYAGAIRNADLARVARVSVLNHRLLHAQLAGVFDEQERALGELEGFTAHPDVELDRLGSMVAAQRQLLAFDRGELSRYVDYAVAFAEEQPETTQRQISTAFVLAWTGRLDDARRYFEPVIAGSPRSFTVEQSLAFILCLAAWTALLLDDEASAGVIEHLLTPFSGRNSCYFGGSFGPTDFALAHCARARGDDALARHRLDRALEQAEAWGARPFAARIRLERAELARRTGDRAAASVDAAAARRTATTLGMAEVAARADRLCAQLGSEAAR